MTLIEMVNMINLAKWVLEKEKILFDLVQSFKTKSKRFKKKDKKKGALTFKAREPTMSIGRCAMFLASLKPRKLHRAYASRMFIIEIN